MRYTEPRRCYTGFPNFCKTENCPYWSHFANRCTYAERAAVSAGTPAHADRVTDRPGVLQPAVLVSRGV